MTKFLIFVLAVLTFASCHKPKPIKPLTEAQIRSSIVMIKGTHGLCTAEAITAPSGKPYLLTAGHCDGLSDPGQPIEAISEDGRKQLVRIIAEDAKSDLLLLEPFNGLQPLPISDRMPQRFDHIRAFGHGRGWPTFSTEGRVISPAEPINVMLNPVFSPEDEAKCVASPKTKVMDALFFKACVLSIDEMITTAKAIPGMSGGPVVDRLGHMVGMVSAGSNEGIGMDVTLKDIKAFLSDK